MIFFVAGALNVTCSGLVWSMIQQFHGFRLGFKMFMFGFYQGSHNETCSGLVLHKDLQWHVFRFGLEQELTIPCIQVWSGRRIPQCDMFRIGLVHNPAMSHVQDWFGA